MHYCQHHAYCRLVNGGTIVSIVPAADQSMVALLSASCLLPVSQWLDYCQHRACCRSVNGCTIVSILPAAGQSMVALLSASCLLSVCQWFHYCQHCACCRSVNGRAIVSIMPAACISMFGARTFVIRVLCHSIVCMRAVIERIRKYTGRHIMYIYESSDRRSSQEVRESSHHVYVREQ